MYVCGFSKGIVHSAKIHGHIEWVNTHKRLVHVSVMVQALDLKAGNKTKSG